MPITLAPDLVFLPFSETWQMRIDIPYSLMVRDGDQMWSCGQCPLTREGAVMAPGDLQAQAGILADFIDGFACDMGMTGSDVSRLTVYYIEEDAKDGASLITLFRAKFGADTLIRLIKVPHFYYDGMRLEVDVYATTQSRRFVRHESADLPGLAVEALQLPGGVWANVQIPQSAQTAGTARLSLALSALCEAAGVVQSEILSELWTLGTPKMAPALQAVRDLGLAAPRLSVVNASTPDPVLSGEITTCTGGGRRIVRVIDTGHATVELTFSRMGAEFGLTAAVTSGPADNLGQMRETMRATAILLRAEGLSFDLVRKVTNLYVAGSSAEELHDNMAIRNEYYSKPGPGSTGIPVSGFPDTLARNAMSLIGRVR